MKKSLFPILFLLLVLSIPARAAFFETNSVYLVTNYVPAATWGGTNLLRAATTNDMRMWQRVTWYARFYGETAGCTTNLDLTFIDTPDETGQTWLTQTTNVISLRANGTNQVFLTFEFTNYPYALQKPALWTNYNSGALTNLELWNSKKGYILGR